MNPATATRQEVREYVIARELEGRQVAQSGGNLNHLKIDQAEQFEAMFAGVTYEERSRFMELYLEEIEAHLDHLERHPPVQPPAKPNPELQALEKQINLNLIWLIVALVVIIVGVVLLRR